ncbi:hypothetical protein GDO81_028299, partial [Engystomops pustulosus]
SAPPLPPLSRCHSERTPELGDPTWSLHIGQTRQAGAMEPRAAGDMDGQNGGSDNSDTKSTLKMILVHLDLKGAPPKVSYLAEVFPLFSALGATGLLIEYEDTFPYDKQLLPLRAAHAY